MRTTTGTKTTSTKMMKMPTTTTPVTTTTKTMSSTNAGMIEGEDIDFEDGFDECAGFEDDSYGDDAFE